MAVVMMTSSVSAQMACASVLLVFASLAVCASSLTRAQAVRLGVALLVAAVFGLVAASVSSAAVVRCAWPCWWI